MPAQRKPKSAMPPKDRSRIESHIRRIESGNFSPGDVEALVISMREYSYGFEVFSELAHFIGHSAIRNRGNTFEVMTAFVVGIKYVIDYFDQGRLVDVNRAMPAYLKQYALLQVKQADNEHLQQNFKIHKKTLEKKIKENLVVDKERDTCWIRKGENKLQFNAALTYLFSSFDFTDQIFHLNEFHEDMESILEYYDCKFDPITLRAHRNRISIVMLRVIGGTALDLGANYVAGYFVAPERGHRTITGQYRGRSGNPTSLQGPLGNLCIWGLLRSEATDQRKDFRQMRVLIKTDLNVYDHTEGLVRVQSTTNEFGPYSEENFPMIDQLDISDNFKLTPAKDAKPLLEEKNVTSA